MDLHFLFHTSRHSFQFSVPFFYFHFGCWQVDTPDPANEIGQKPANVISQRVANGGTPGPANGTTQNPANGIPRDIAIEIAQDPGCK